MIRLIVSVERVKRRQDEVAGLCGGERGADRLFVAHLADQDHVGVLAQDALHRLGEALRVGADLALVDDRELVPVEVLDRVLHRHDVTRPGRVDVVDHRRERRRLARAGRPREQNDPAGLLGQPAHDLGEAEVIDRPDLEGDRPQRDRDGAALAEGVDTEARDAFELVGEVGLAVLLELGELLGARDLLQRTLGLRRAEGVGALKRPEVAVDARNRRRVSLDVEVGSLPLDDVRERLIDVETHPSPYRAWAGSARSAKLGCYGGC
jgi:hypothetical protein